MQGKDFFENRYFFINKFFLSCIGQWPYHSTVRNRLIQSVIFIALLIYLTTLVAGFIRGWGNPNNMGELLPTIITDLGCLAYTIIYVYKEKQVRTLFNEIKYDWQVWSSREDRCILSNQANYGRIYTIIFTGCITATSVTYMGMAVSPQILDIILPLNESRPKKLPFQGYYFVNYSDEYFYCVMTYILFNTIIQVCVLVGSESVVAVFTEHAGGIFKLVGFCNIIESLFCPCFFIIMALNAILISVSLIQVVVNLDKIDIAVRFGAFTVASIAYIFLRSLPGQRLTDHSVSIADNIYDGMWYEMPSNIRKLLLLIMIRSSVPSKLTAGKMLDLGLSNVSSILQTSFSYFTLLSSMRL